MNPTVVVALIGAVSGLGALAIGILNLIAGKGGRKADEAKTLTDTGMELLTEVKAKCDRCEKDLLKLKKCLRVAVKAYDAKDQHAIDAAIELARELI